LFNGALLLDVADLRFGKLRRRTHDLQTPLGTRQRKHQAQPLPVRMHPMWRHHQRNFKRNQMNIINTIKAMYAAPSPETLALRELEQSRRDLLVSHTQQEYSLKMVEFHKNKIKRLTAFLKQTMEDEQT
jgi:hypothetical protein